jgi:electron transport complex protein RnfD
MINRKKLVVSHAPFWHNGSSIAQRHYNILLAAVPAAALGCFRYGMPAVGVVSFSIAFAMIWEWVMNRITRQPVTIGDGSAALTGLLLAMLLPASAPWWLVIVGTFLAIVIGKHIFGGIGSNPVNMVALTLAILSLSWEGRLEFNEALVNYDFGFPMAYPLAELKHFGTAAIGSFSYMDLLLGRQIGGIGAPFGLALMAGGIYLILRGFIRWEIVLSFLAGVFITAMVFYSSNAEKFADPLFHLLTGYTLIGAIFLATDDSSSPVGFIPMLIYGAVGGFMTVLIRNIGVWVDGVALAILIANIVSPLLDKIRPKVVGKVS